MLETYGFEIAPTIESVNKNKYFFTAPI